MQLAAIAASILNQGGIIAYPTEAVYGLGCDPFNQEAVKRLLILKNRSVKKGLILIAANWEQIENLIAPIPMDNMAQVKATWPGPITWTFPASKKAPKWICGDHSTIALRITAHPVAKNLCLAFGKPIVSTSANREGETPAKTSADIKKIFGDEIELIIPGKTGELNKPTEIRDVISGKILRDNI